MCIIQRIVQEHGGETVLSSQPGVGTTVKFLLPLAGEGSAKRSEKVAAVESATKLSR